MEKMKYIDDDIFSDFVLDDLEKEIERQLNKKRKIEEEQKKNEMDKKIKYSLLRDYNLSKNYLIYIQSYIYDSINSFFKIDDNNDAKYIEIYFVRDRNDDYDEKMLYAKHLFSTGFKYSILDYVNKGTKVDYRRLRFENITLTTKTRKLLSLNNKLIEELIVLFQKQELKDELIGFIKFTLMIEEDPEYEKEKEEKEEKEKKKN